MLLSIPFSHFFLTFRWEEGKEIKKKFNSICKSRQQRRRWQMLFCCDTFGDSERDVGEEERTTERAVDSIEMPEYIRIKESFIIFFTPPFSSLSPLPPFAPALSAKRLNYLNLFSLFIFSEKSEEYKFHSSKLL